METLHPLTAYRQRQAPPLTVAELAKKLGKHKGTVSRWEAGRRRPDLDELSNITKVTGIAGHLLRPDLAALLAPAKSGTSARPRRSATRGAHAA
jgi:transcriptional regulator with XRE-family HTH domain